MPKTNKKTVLILAFLTVLSLSTLSACSTDSPLGQFSTATKQASTTVQNFAKNNPSVDAVTNNGISTLGLLLYSIGATAGLFVQGKGKKKLSDAIEEIVSDKTNNVSIETLPSKETRKIVRKAVNNA